MKLFLLGAVLVLCGGLASYSFAQEDDDSETPRQIVINTFNRQAPKIGEPLPQLELLSASGDLWDSSVLRGHYTVLVSGCLT